MNPKPYLIVYDGYSNHTTEVDHEGGHFPKWDKLFFLKKDLE